MKSKSVEMTIPSYGIVMKYYLRKDMNTDVVQLFKEFVGKGNRKPSDEMLTAVLKAYFATNDTHSATELFETVIQFKESPPITTFFNEYMDGLINSNNTASALDTFDVMRSLSVDPDIQTINILIKAYTSIGNISSAYKLFKSLPSQYQHLRANVITYTTLITGLLTDSINIKIAESLLQEMTTLGIQPTVQTFTTFIHGYLSKKKTLKAFEMYQKMVDEHRIKPNVVTFTTLIKYFADLHEEGAGQRCWQIYTDMISRKVKPDIAVLTVLLKRFIKDGNDEGIKTVIDERKRWKVKADDRFDNVIAWYNGAKKE
ncbi:hypothetical protein BKA69DRAFT_1078373 [Paraphysoderma sedebokerense]|nr:hypothetical protein BKA69DRAFT_1078373 [Paraphysoderma sedebokerense]